MIPSFDDALWRRASWTVLALACLGYLLLGLAEQGARGSAIATPPEAPLPFERHRVFGLDLSAMSSLQALDWLNAAGNPSLALTIVPIDADVVTALGSDEDRPAAIAAIDTLRAAAGSAPLAACLRPPLGDGDHQAIAQSAVDALRNRFPDQFVYVSACDGHERTWRSAVVDAAQSDLTTTENDRALVPMSAGPILHVRELEPDERISSERVGTLAAGGYTAISVERSEPLAAEIIERSASALMDTAFAALILIAPSGEVDPGGLVASFANVVLSGNRLAEGYTSVLAPGMTANESWTRTNVATVSYLRTSSTGAGLAAEFVGTDLYLLGLASPDSGVIEVWIDPASPTAQPTIVIDLASLQAQDVAVPIATGLPAARHEVVLQAVTADGETVMISGLFVTGEPATTWNGAAAAIALIVIASASLTERSYAAITAIRRRSGPSRRRVLAGHPRVFARDR